MNDPLATANIRSEGDSLWTLRDVTLRGVDRPRLDRVSVALPEGRVALAGVSGAGKSSLLSLLAGFEAPDSGELKHSTFSPEPSLPLFWSPQDGGLWPHLTVHEHLQTVQPSSPRMSAAAWLDLFRLAPVTASRPGELSAGERSRLSVARALASEAEVLLLDEPFAHVDAAHRDEDWRAVMDHASRFCRGLAFATHDPSVIRAYADHVICLESGRVVFSGAMSELLYSPPDRTTGWLLGPCNWLDENLMPFFAGVDASRTCVRPEETYLVRDSNAVLTATRMDCRGTTTCFELRDEQTEQSITIYALHDAGIDPGAKVSIQVRQAELT